MHDLPNCPDWPLCQAHSKQVKPTSSRPSMAAFGKSPLNVFRTLLPKTAVRVGRAPLFLRFQISRIQCRQALADSQGLARNSAGAAGGIAHVSRRPRDFPARPPTFWYAGWPTRPGRERIVSPALPVQGCPDYCRALFNYQQFPRPTAKSGHLFFRLHHGISNQKGVRHLAKPGRKTGASARLCSPAHVGHCSTRHRIYLLSFSESNPGRITGRKKWGRRN